MLIQAASAAEQVRAADRVFPDASLDGIDVEAIVSNTEETLSAIADGGGGGGGQPGCRWGRV